MRILAVRWHFCPQSGMNDPALSPFITEATHVKIIADEEYVRN